MDGPSTRHHCRSMGQKMEGIGKPHDKRRLRCQLKKKPCANERYMNRDTWSPEKVSWQLENVGQLTRHGGDPPAPRAR